MAIGTALTNAYVHISCAMQACELFAWRDRPQALRHVHGLSRFLPSLRELGAKQALDIFEERPLAPIWRGEGLSVAKVRTNGLAHKTSLPQDRRFQAVVHEKPNVFQLVRFSNNPAKLGYLSTSSSTRSRRRTVEPRVASCGTSQDGWGSHVAWRRQPPTLRSHADHPTARRNP